jgi:hypothetical protein
MPNNPAPQRQMETRATNKTAHPGDVVKATTKKRRTAAEVEEARRAKAQAKVDLEVAKQLRIIRAAEFEHADMANADQLDATPRPVFTPKPRKQTQYSPTPTETCDVEMSDDRDFDKAEFAPPSADDSVTADDSAVESDPPPPAKKSKVQPADTAKKTAMKKKEVAKMESKESEVDVVPDSEAQQPKECKPRFQVRNEINGAAKKIEENRTQGNKYSEMVKSMTSKQGEKESGENPAPKSKGKGKDQAVTGGSQRLVREGAIGDIKHLFDEEIPAKRSEDSDQKQVPTDKT